MNLCEPANGIHVIPRGSQVCVCGQTSRSVPDARAFGAWKDSGQAAASAPEPAPKRVAPAKKTPAPEPAPVVETAPAVEPAPAPAAEVAPVVAEPEAPAAEAAAPAEAPAAEGTSAEGGEAAAPAPKEGRRKRAK